MMPLTETDIVIYGGGMAGAMLAKALPPQFQIVLVDPNEYFEVPMAAPRSLVKPEFADQAIVPFTRALPNVRHIRATLAEMRAGGGLVRLKDGAEIVVKGRVSVLATGSAFSNPLMRAIGGASVDERKDFYRSYRERLSAAQRILIVGGGPVGVEVAGEIVEHHPDKAITLLEAGPRLLAGTSEGAAEYATRFLQERGVEVLLNERLQSGTTGAADVFAGGGEAFTDQGRSIAYDLLVWCIGGKPNTAYMKERFPTVLNHVGRIRVTPELRVAGQEALFALGDITDLDENKMAWHINGQVKTAAHNIRVLLGGGASTQKLRKYKPQTGNPMMAVTLGSRHGVVHLPVVGTVRWSAFVRMAKSGHMLVPQYRKALAV